MLIIFNPVAGRRRGGLLYRVLDLLTEQGVVFELASTLYAGHATQLARQAARDGVPVVVAAGGDGTIAEIANGLIGSDTFLGIIPLGTANVLSKEYNLPTAAHDIINALKNKRCKYLWPGVAQLPDQQHLFIQMLGIGFDGAVVHGVRPGLKRIIGKGAYVWQSLHSAACYTFPPVNVRIDGAAHQAANVIVSKGRLYGGAYMLAPQARPEAPGFQVALFEKSGFWPALLAGAALPLGLLPRYPGMRLIRASHIEFAATDERILAQADGDSLPALPVSVVDAQTPLSLIIR